MHLAEIGSKRPLGKTGLSVSSIGIGTNRWRKGGNDASVAETYRALMDGRIDFVDTAEIYGFGKSERLIGTCLTSDPRPAFIASKFAPFLARTSPTTWMQSKHRRRNSQRFCSMKCERRWEPI